MLKKIYHLNKKRNNFLIIFFNKVKKIKMNNDYYKLHFFNVYKVVDSLVVFVKLYNSFYVAIILSFSNF